MQNGHRITMEPDKNGKPTRPWSKEKRGQGEAGVEVAMVENQPAVAWRLLGSVKL